MSVTVDALISLRSQVISGFVEGEITEEAYEPTLTLSQSSSIDS